MGPQDQRTDRDGVSTAGTGLTALEVIDGTVPEVGGNLVELMVLDAGLAIAAETRHAGETAENEPSGVTGGRGRRPARHLRKAD